MNDIAAPDFADVLGLDDAKRAGALASVLSVARTIADLAGRDNIAAAHLAEAVGYRSHRFGGAPCPTSSSLAHEAL